MMKRVFVGLQMPPSCAAELQQLDPGIPGVTWLPSDQFYMALSHEWELDPNAEERLAEALGKIRVKPFFLPLAGIGVFGRPPKVVVSVGIGKGHPHFFALHRKVQDAAIQAQLAPDLKPFHPHVTVARAEETPKGSFQKFLRQHVELEICLWEVSNFSLFETSSSADSPSRTVLRQFEL